MKSGIAGDLHGCLFPDCATLHPGYLVGVSGLWFTGLLLGRLPASLPKDSDTVQFTDPASGVTRTCSVPFRKIIPVTL